MAGECGTNGRRRRIESRRTNDPPRSRLGPHRPRRLFQFLGSLLVTPTASRMQPCDRKSLAEVCEVLRQIYPRLSRLIPSADVNRRRSEPHHRQDNGEVDGSRNEWGRRSLLRIVRADVFTLPKTWVLITENRFRVGCAGPEASRPGAVRGSGLRPRRCHASIAGSRIASRKQCQLIPHSCCTHRDHQTCDILGN